MAANGRLRIARFFCALAAMLALFPVLAHSAKRDCTFELLEGPSKKEIRAAIRVVALPMREKSAEIRQKARNDFHSALTEWTNAGYPLTETAKIIQLASVHLETQGVAHEVTDEFNQLRIRILAKSESKVRLNKVAAKLYAEYLTELFFEPARFSKEGAPHALFRWPANPQDSGYIQLGIQSIKTPTEVDPTLAHEIVHALKPRRLVKKQEYAFYGLVKVDSENENLLLPRNYEQQTYPRKFAFDEIEAHYAQIKNLIKKGTGPSLRQAVAYSKRLSRLCQQTIELVMTAQSHLVWQKSPARFSRTPWGIEARMNFELDGVPIRLENYLVKAENVRQKKKNLALLSAQLKLLSATSSRRLGQARELRKKAERALKNAPH